MVEPGAVPRPQPARQSAGGAGHGDAAGVAAERARKRVEAALEPLDHPGVGALLGCVDARRLLERGADVAEHVEVDLHARVGEGLERAGAPVGGGRAADGHDHALGARLDGGGDQLAGAARGGGPGVALLLLDQAEAARLGGLNDGDAAVLDQGEGGLDGPAERIAHLDGAPLAAESSGNPPTPVPNATSARERQPSSSALASVERVARSMMSAEVGPPSSIVAAWMTQRAGMSPAVVSTASPSPIGARSSDSRCTSGPPAREIAPATPPPCFSSVLAALAIASTSSLVTSAARTSKSAMRTSLSICASPVRR